MIWAPLAGLPAGRPCLPPGGSSALLPLFPPHTPTAQKGAVSPLPLVRDSAQMINLSKEVQARQKSHDRHSEEICEGTAG